jgi:Ser/Thr protein kinase RdoA (MazF antagonist)
VEPADVVDEEDDDAHPWRMSLTTDDSIADEAVRQWLGEGATRTPLVAMNSSAWMVSSGAERYVLKIANASQQAGLRVSEWLDERGLPTGSPKRMTVRGDRVVALLRFVDGRGLETSSGDVDLLGETLGRTHSLLVGAPVPEGLDRWPWVWPDPGVIDEPALRRAASKAIDTAERLAPSLTHGILHGDPAPEAFLDDEGGIALIDWGAACHGPLLYDVASAWFYSGERVLAAYARTAPIGADELVAAADFLAFRWAVQAWYFSDRIRRHDVAGLSGEADNDKGLADARRGLLG